MNAWNRSKSRQGFGVGFRIFDVVEAGCSRMTSGGRGRSKTHQASTPRPLPPWKLLNYLLLFPALLKSRCSTESSSSKDSKLATPNSRSCMPTYSSTRPSFLPCTFCRSRSGSAMRAALGALCWIVEGYTEALFVPPMHYRKGKRKTSVESGHDERESEGESDDEEEEEAETNPKSRRGPATVGRELPSAPPCCLTSPGLSCTLPPRNRVAPRAAPSPSPPPSSGSGFNARSAPAQSW